MIKFRWHYCWKTKKLKEIEFSVNFRICLLASWCKLYLWSRSFDLWSVIGRHDCQMHSKSILSIKFRIQKSIFHTSNLWKRFWMKLSLRKKYVWIWKSLTLLSSNFLLVLKPNNQKQSNSFALINFSNADFKHLPKTNKNLILSNKLSLMNC